MWRSERFRLTFVVGYAIASWAREHGVGELVSLAEMREGVDRYIAEATAMLDQPGDFESDVLAEIERLTGE